MIGYSSAAGTATAGSDYTSVTNNLTIPAGQTSGTINVPILDDAIYEGDETVFTMNLSAVSGVAIADNQGTGTIVENDAVPNVTVDDPVVAVEQRPDDLYDLARRGGRGPHPGGLRDLGQHRDRRAPTTPPRAARP